MNLSSACTIGWRNIWRNRMRTILTLLAIAFACGILVFFVALQFSSYETSIQATISIFYGHLQVQPEGYLEKPEMRKTLGSVSALTEQLRRVPGVRSLSPRGIGFALVSSERRSYGTQIVGVLPSQETEVSTIPGTLRAGEYFTSDSAQEVVLGSQLAKNLKVTIGDELTLLGQGWDGSLAATVLPVVGIFETGSNEIDRGMIQIPLAVFQEVFSMPDRAHSVVISTERLADVPALQQRVREALSEQSETAVLRWDQVVPGLKEAIELDLASSWLFYLSLILIVTFTVLNTFLMSVLERTKEFCILLALGTKPRALVGMVLIECGLLTVVGILFGMLFGTALILYFGKFGFAVPGAEEIVKQWNIPAIVYTRLSIRPLLQGPLVLLGAALFSVLFPAAKIFRLEPVDAIGGR